MDQRIEQVIARVRAFIDTKDDAWALPEVSARFVHGIVLACKARRCVEIGTSYGYSGLWIGAAAAANGGTLVTIDIEQRKSDIARGYFREAGLDVVIDCRVAPAAEVLAALSGPIDLALNDADKENCIHYAELLHALMPIGGVVLTDNATSNEVVAGEFLPWVRADRRFASALIDVGNGIECSVKVA